MSEHPPYSPAEERVTLRTIRRWLRDGRKFPMLTCYDATTAAWLWRGGVKCLLVGDTAGQVIEGHDSTIPATMGLQVALTAAVRRGAPQAFVMADMPFGSYQCGDDRAMAHAIAFLKRGMADAVKLEVEAYHADLVERLAKAGVPVVAHLGSRPQTVRQRGGYGSVGRTKAEAGLIIDTADLMLARGASMLLLEAVPAEVAARVAELCVSAKRQPRPVPLIGCGAGPACHGHVVVLQDLLGLSDWQPPFVKPLADVGAQIQGAAAKWAELVESGRYLRDDHPYKMLES